MKNKPLKIYIFYCSTSLETEDLIHGCSKFVDDELKVISLPCSGKVDVLYLIKAFETGADGVIVVTCKKGECRYLEGSIRAQKRAEAVDALLQEIGMGKGRMAVIRLKEGGTEQLIGEIEDFLDEIKKKVNPVIG